MQNGIHRAEQSAHARKRIPLPWNNVVLLAEKRLFLNRDHFDLLSTPDVSWSRNYAAGFDTRASVTAKLRRRGENSLKAMQETGVKMRRGKPRTEAIPQKSPADVKISFTMLAPPPAPDS
jgi:hypothetical protein